METTFFSNILESKGQRSTIFFEIFADIVKNNPTLSIPIPPSPKIKLQIIKKTKTQVDFIFYKLIFLLIIM